MRVWCVYVWGCVGECAYVWCVCECFLWGGCLCLRVSECGYVWM